MVSLLHLCVHAQIIFVHLCVCHVRVQTYGLYRWDPLQLSVTSGASCQSPRCLGCHGGASGWFFAPPCLTC